MKEAEAFSEAGYRVHLVYTRHVKYLLDQDQAILDRNPNWTYNYLDWVGSNLTAQIIKIVSGLKRKLSEMIFRRGLYSKRLTPILLNRFYFWQLKKAVANKADLYIAHYPQSIGIAAKAAAINNSLFAYDAEDYHRGEGLPLEITKAISLVEDRFLSNASYISVASPLIAKAYKLLFSSVPIIEIENAFPLKRQVGFQRLKETPVKFLWFSQTIGENRGLEQFVSILGHVAYPFQLTLLGYISKNYRETLENLWSQTNLNPNDLIFLKTVPEQEIFEIAASHHIGLCLEIPAVLNKDFCLSNKLYTYIMSGNALILSKTQGQDRFYQTYQNSGISIDLNNPSLAARHLIDLIYNKQFLDEVRFGNYVLGAQVLNFDNEKKKLLYKIAQILKIC